MDDEEAWLAQVKQRVEIYHAKHAAEYAIWDREQAWQAARQHAPPPPQARHVQNMGYGSGMGYANYREPPLQHWGHTYHPHDRNHHNPSWTNPMGGPYAPSYLPQPQFQEQRPLPSPQVQNDPALIALLEKMVEEVEKVTTEMSELKAVVEARGIVIQEVKLQIEQVEAFVIQNGEAPTDFVTLNHERAEVIEAMEIAESEEVPEELVPLGMEEEDIPLNLGQPIFATGVASDDGAEDVLTTHIHEEDITVNVIPSRDTPTDFAHDLSVEVCSRKDSDALVEQVVHEIEILSGVEKAQVHGMRQERKAAKQQKLEEIKSGPSSRCKDRQAEMKGAMAAPRKMKPSTPRHTTKVKMKAKRGVDGYMAPREEGASSGRCVPMMEYLKFIGGKHLFPPPFIP